MADDTQAQIDRKQTRLDFLKKNRPNDPEIKKRQQEIKALKGQLAAAPPSAPQTPAPPDTEGNRALAGETNFKDAGSVAGSQGIANDQTQKENLTVNNPNLSSALGTSTVTYDPNTGQPTVTQRMSDSQQGLYTAETGADTTAANLAQGLLGGLNKSPYDPNSVNGQYGIPTANDADRSRIEGDLYSKYTQDYDQNQQKELEAKNQELANRGIPVGSEQYNDQIDQINKRYDRAKLEARTQATAGGGAEEASQFGMGLQSHQQALGDYQSGYTLPTSVAGSLVGIGQGYQQQNPYQFTGASQAPVDFTGLYGTATGAQAQKDQLGQQGSQFKKSLAEQIREANLDYQAKLKAIKASQASSAASTSTDPDVGGYTAGS